MLDRYTEDSSIVGTCTTDGAYDDAVKALMKRFPQITITAARLLVRFKDPEVLRVLLDNAVHLSPEGFTEEELLNITDIGTWYSDNTTIHSFEELRKTGVKSLKSSAFSNCSNLDVRSGFLNIETLGDGCLNGVFSKCCLLPNVKTASNSHICANLTDLGINFNNCTIRTVYAKTDQKVNICIVRYIGEPTISASFAGNAHSSNYGIKNLFVPPSMVDYWKANYTRATNTCAIGGEEWQSVMQQLAAEEGYELKPGESWADEYIDYKIYGVEPPTE